MTQDRPAEDAHALEDPRVAALTREVEALRAEVLRLGALADHDPLTPALNRRAFLRELHRAMAYCRRHAVPAAVLYLDLDGFKGVNDRHGHLAGDAALVRVAELLTEHVRESDLVARLGGDEFGVLLQHADAEAALAKAASLAEVISQEPFRWEGLAFRLGGSFGVRALADQPDAETWLAEADAAMFVRKRRR